MDDPIYETEQRHKHCHERVAILQAEIERLRKIEWHAAKVVETFRKDEAQGFRSRDRQYAIAMLGEFVDEQIAAKEER